MFFLPNVTNPTCFFSKFQKNEKSLQPTLQVTRYRYLFWILLLLETSHSLTVALQVTRYLFWILLLLETSHSQALQVARYLFWILRLLETSHSHSSSGNSLSIWDFISFGGTERLYFPENKLLIACWAILIFLTMYKNIVFDLTLITTPLWTGGRRSWRRRGWAT